MPNPWLELPKILTLHYRNRKAMEAYQERRLIGLIRNVYTGNEFYRRLWDDAGFRLEQFKGREDMAMLPIVTKQQIRDLGQMLLAEASGGSYVREEDIGRLPELLGPLSSGRVVESETLIWQSYWWFAAIVILVTTEWLLRKRAGLL